MGRLAGDEQIAEVGAAGGEDQLVGVEGLGLRLKADISEGVGREKVAEQLKQLSVVAAPLENILRIFVIRGLFGDPIKTFAYICTMTLNFSFESKGTSLCL